MKTRLCPKCKSENITLFAGGHTGQYQCKKCGYIGPLIIEKDIKPTKLVPNLKNKR